MRSYISISSFVVFLLFSVFFVALVYVAGTYDSQVYYSHFKSIADEGFFEFASQQIQVAGKLEPGLYVIYSLLPFLDFESFLLFNGWLIFFSSLFYYRLTWKHGYSRVDSFWFYFVIFFVLWYPLYINYMWVWRSYISVSLFSCGVLSFLKFRYLSSFVFFFLSLLFHVSFIFYFLIFMIVYYSVFFFESSRFSRGSIFFVGFLFSLAFSVLVFFALGSFGFMVSGGDIWQANYNYTGFIVSVYFMMIIVPFLFLSKSRTYNNENFYLFCILIFLINFALSVVFFNNHLVLNRFTILSYFLFVPFFLLFYPELGVYFRVYVFLLILIGVLFFFFSVGRYFLEFTV